MIEAGTFALLAFASIDDMLRKKINLVLIIAFGVLGIGLRIYLRDMALWEVIAGAAIGAVLLLVGVLSRGQIGSGDACLLMTTGIYLGFWENLTLLWLASFVAGIISLGFWLICHKGRKYKIPFAPFLLGAYVSMVVIGGW